MPSPRFPRGFFGSDGLPRGPYLWFAGRLVVLEQAPEDPEAPHRFGGPIPFPWSNLPTHSRVHLEAPRRRMPSSSSPPAPVAPSAPVAAIPTARAVCRLRGIAGLALMLACGGAAMAETAAPPPPPLLQSGDVLAFVGGAGVVAQDQSGVVETVLTLAHPGKALRFRSLGWEGDTVFDAPREPNFPALTNLLTRAGATVVAVQFGALEALDPAVTPGAFADALGSRLDSISRGLPGARLVLVTPPPFEAKAPPLPDLRPANLRLDRLAEVIRAAGVARGIPVLDVHREFPNALPPGSAWTVDGRELNPSGHRALGAIWARAYGRPDLAVLCLRPEVWHRADLGALLGAVGRKNRLWFDYWRPMNWAFLGGDRTDQLSSRDHLDPKIRWFPAEMERFVPLIAEAEVRIGSLAAQVQLPPATP